MHSSLLIKRIIRIAALGVILAAVIGTFGFVCYMGQEFGFKDLGCTQFPETKRFAVELRNMLYSLENDASYLKNYETGISDEVISINNLYYEESAYRSIRPDVGRCKCRYGRT